jgi:hypothetical protein
MLGSWVLFAGSAFDVMMSRGGRGFWVLSFFPSFLQLYLSVVLWICYEFRTIHTSCGSSRHLTSYSMPVSITSYYLV